MVRPYRQALQHVGRWKGRRRRRGKLPGNGTESRGKVGGGLLWSKRWGPPAAAGFAPRPAGGPRGTPI